jgi:hypothetical protein
MPKNNRLEPFPDSLSDDSGTSCLRFIGATMTQGKSAEDILRELRKASQLLQASIKAIEAFAREQYPNREFG